MTAAGMHFLTPILFSDLVEKKAAFAKIPLLEAIMIICDERHIEVETVRGLLTKALKIRITLEAVEANLLKKSVR